MRTELPNERHLSLEAYKLLTDLLKHEEDLFWRRNEIFLIINGALFGILGLIRPAGAGAAFQTPRVTSLVACAIGVVLCLLWLFIVRRGEAFYNHFYEQLIFLEKQYLAPINVYQLTAEYFAKGRIKLGEKELKLDFLSKTIHIYHASLAAPLVFLASWFSLAIYLVFYN